MTTIVLAVAAVLIIGISNAVTWALTRIRNERYGYERGYEAGWIHGARQATRDSELTP